jgi:predicted Zn-ribbon and HTH transcriptional regulator
LGEAVKKVPKKPPIPRTAGETFRHAVIALLSRQTLSAKDISFEASIAEKEVYGHLEHIRRSIHAIGGVLEMTPAECRTCGFVFAKRDRLTPPGKCPVCRSESINEPLFTIRGAEEHETSFK